MSPRNPRETPCLRKLVGELIRPVSSVRALFFLHSHRQSLCHSTFKSSPTLRDFHTDSISVNHVDRHGVSSALFCKFHAPLLGLTAFASACLLAITKQTQVGDQCAGLGGNTIANFPLPMQSASSNGNPLELSILGASAGYVSVENVGRKSSK